MLVMTKTAKVKIEHPCKYDGKEIPNWRRNKLFCSDVCKFKYHNEQRAVVDEDIKHIHKILADNYSVLKSVIGEEESVETEHKTLEGMKFDFQFCTQLVGDYHNVYTLSWLRLSNGKYKISKVPRKTYRGGYTIR
jgi:hypothetical protein